MYRFFFLISFLVLKGCLSTNPDQQHSRMVVFDESDTEGTGYYPVGGVYQKLHYSIQNGQAIVGGDIVLDREKLLESPPQTSASTARSAGTTRGDFWPSRYISYYIDGLSGPDAAVVVSGMNEFDAQTNLVFTQVFSPPVSGAYIRFVPGIASSGVGYPGDNQAGNVSVGSPATKYHVLHEVGHRLGLWHEHQRPDRDLYLNMYPRNHCKDPFVEDIDTRAYPYHVKCAGGWASNMAIVYGSYAVGPFDFHSIMMYWHGAWRMMDVNGKGLEQPAIGSGYDGPDFVLPARRVGYSYATMLRKGYDYATQNESYNWDQTAPKDINGEQVLSAQDIATINSMYPINPTAVGWIDMGNCTGLSGYIQQDDEDVGNATQAMAWITSGSPAISHNYNGTKGIYRVTLGSGHHEFTRINWCRETISILPVLRSDYAVLKMSEDCPLNSFSFSRTADNENNSNANSSSGVIFPSSTTTGGAYNGSTTLHFCFVPGDGDFNPSAPPAPPWLSRQAGAFTAGDGAYGGFEDFESSCTYHWHVQDDEDVNAFSGGGNYHFTASSLPYEARIKAIFNYSTTETHYNWHECDF